MSESTSVFCETLISLNTLFLFQFSVTTKTTITFHFNPRTSNTLGKSSKCSPTLSRV